MIPVFSIIISLSLPLFVILKYNKSKALKRPYLYSVLSFAACSFGIIAEIFTIKNRLFAGDIGGIEDTIGAVIIICIIMLASTALLNLIALVMNYEKDWMGV